MFGLHSRDEILHLQQSTASLLHCTRVSICACSTRRRCVATDRAVTVQRLKSTWYDKRSYDYATIFLRFYHDFVVIICRTLVPIKNSQRTFTNLGYLSFIYRFLIHILLQGDRKWMSNWATICYFKWYWSTLFTVKVERNKNIVNISRKMLEV